MKYLVEGNLLDSERGLGECNCWVNVGGKCDEQCTGHGCGYNTCPTHCFTKACNPRTDPWSLK